MEEKLMIIHGKDCEAISQKRFSVINPANEGIIGSVPSGGVPEADKAIESAQKAFGMWKKVPPLQRAQMLSNFADKIAKAKERLAKLLCLEHGKIYKEGLAEIDDAVGYLEQAAKGIVGIHGDILFSTEKNEQIWIQRVPYGVTVGLLAWNFPVALAARKLGPALAAGNTMVIHSPSDVPLAVIEFARLALESGIPEGVFNVVTGKAEEICPALIQNPFTRLVSHTGSTPAGQKIIASSVQNVTDLILELGGKAPYIVLEDADIDKAVDAAVVARFYNNGQVCTCNERTFLHEHIYDEFLEKFLARVKKLTVGSQFSGADLGPKVLKRDVERIEILIKKALEMGAHLEYRAERPNTKEFEKGHWSFPAVLSNVTTDMELMRQEIFGPVVPIMKIKNFEQAVQLSNNCEYGLAAYLWTSNFSKIMQTVDDLDAGSIFINRGIGGLFHGFHTGMKKSGIGGEDGKYGLESYFHKKTYYINY